MPTSRTLPQENTQETICNSERHGPNIKLQLDETRNKRNDNRRSYVPSSSVCLTTGKLEPWLTKCANTFVYIRQNGQPKLQDLDQDQTNIKTIGQKVCVLQMICLHLFGSYSHISCKTIQQIITRLFKHT